MGLGEEIADKGAECMKEILLYTPGGAAFLSQIAWLDGQYTHYVLIFCFPATVLCLKVIKGNREHRKHIAELEAQPAE